MLDLHCHSTFSDGLLSPEELLQKALSRGLKYLSLTDHDTLAGYPCLIQAASKTPITIIPGVELSTRWKKHDLHILGYHVQATGDFNQILEAQNASRIKRAQDIGALLELAGVHDAYEKACTLAGHQHIGRVHFAKVLMQEGRVREMQPAFTQFLGRGKRAYVPTSWLSMQEAVIGITESGGQAVIAHPLKYGLTRSKLHELIKDFKEAGGVGIEVVSGDMTITHIREMAATCLRFDLFASSGSDYHGPGMSRIALGCQQPLPDNCSPLWKLWTTDLTH